MSCSGIVGFQGKTELVACRNFGQGGIGTLLATGDSVDVSLKLYSNNAIYKEIWDDDLAGVAVVMHLTNTTISGTTFSEYIEFIIVYLDVWNSIYFGAKGKDLTSHFIGNEGETEVYELDIFPTIKQTFTFHISLLLNKDVLPNPQEYFERYDEYIDIVSRKWTELTFLLDEKLFYFDGKVPDDLKSRSMRFYPDELFESSEFWFE
mgnify:CR=1 FL=1